MVLSLTPALNGIALRDPIFKFNFPTRRMNSFRLQCVRCGGRLNPWRIMHGDCGKKHVSNRACVVNVFPSKRGNGHPYSFRSSRGSAIPRFQPPFRARFRFRAVPERKKNDSNKRRIVNLQKRFIATWIIPRMQKPMMPLSVLRAVASQTLNIKWSWIKPMRMVT